MDKTHLSESDICDKYIRPAMERAGWNGLDQIFREYPMRAGRVVVRGSKAYRDKSTVLRADYALFYKANIPLAVVEAKDNKHAVGAGTLRAANWNLDQKNPHVGEQTSHDPDVLLADYARLQNEAQALRDELKGILAQSLIVKMAASA